MTTELAIPGIDRLDLGSLIFARNFEQYCKMLEDLRAGKCSFCGELDPEFNELVFENAKCRGWYYKKIAKRANLDYQALIAPYAHITDQSDITADLGYCVFDIFHKFCMKDNLPGGAIFMRFGDPWLNCGTQRHVHFNVKVPNGEGEVREPFRKTIAEFEEDQKKALAFEKMRLNVEANGVTPEAALLELAPADYELVKDRLK